MRVVFLLLTCVLCLFPVSSFGENDAIIYVVTAPSGASLRESPKATAKKLAQVPVYSEVKWEEGSAEGAQESITVEGITAGWEKVSWQGKTGYIFAGLLCSNPEEMREIKAMAKQVKREMNRLTFTPANGKEVVLADKPACGETFLSYRFAGTLPGQHFFVVKQVGFEWWSMLLVNMKDGRQHQVDNLPVFSPDGERFVTANLDVQAGFVSNRLQIFKMVDGMGTLEWELEPSDWGPKNAVWESPTRIKFSKTDREDKETPAAVEFNAADKTWHLVE